MTISQPARASVQDLLTIFSNAWKSGQTGGAYVQSDTLRSDSLVTTGHLDNEPLISVHFVYTNRTTNTPVEMTAWFARHRDLALQMGAFSVSGKAAPTHAATANAILNPVTFLT